MTNGVPKNVFYAHNQDTQRKIFKARRSAQIPTGRNAPTLSELAGEGNLHIKRNKNQRTDLLTDGETSPEGHPGKGDVEKEGLFRTESNLRLHAN